VVFAITHNYTKLLPQPSVKSSMIIQDTTWWNLNDKIYSGNKVIYVHKIEFFFLFNSQIWLGPESAYFIRLHIHTSDLYKCEHVLVMFEDKSISMFPRRKLLECATILHERSGDHMEKVVITWKSTFSQEL